jgi:FAD dependent oxidoreductase
MKGVCRSQKRLSKYEMGQLCCKAIFGFNMAADTTINSVSEGMGLEIFGDTVRCPTRVRPSLTHWEAARKTPVFVETDVLVIGGGPSGTTAAVAAARLGADVTLVERYNHLGGLSTGGVVIWIDRMSDWSGTQVIAGLARELLDRLPKDAVMGPPRADWGSRDAATAEYWSYRSAAFQDIVTWSPTIDPEALYPCNSWSKTRSG